MLANTVADMVTDTLIITVPANLLWKVRISLRSKIALAGIFSLTVFVMIFAIVRVVTIRSHSTQMDPTWMFMWNFVEQTVDMLF
ncbi:hypothetical protein GJ744_001404 [Endocarpon pusillum]|uniref:Rhodopsin domain-containing protein n=1 Tax=Endocarpon pusillum TaxID=364733 RepID=A0A8H7E6Q6_9EURO|nr:hypothetical protein GJ744_001404 [Endocarpon pusillum]